ncbi:hypothetical protein BgiBS90_006462 [Biomphalaria glabrata]|nr:hypothetical protein BgiBS90_006462 [Biomphalaria glabrata]
MPTSFFLVGVSPTDASELQKYLRPLELAELSCSSRGVRSLEKRNHASSLVQSRHLDPVIYIKGDRSESWTPRKVLEDVIRT